MDGDTTRDAGERSKRSPGEQSNVQAPHEQPIEQVAAAWGTDATAGLTEAEAGARLGRDGPNELPADPPVPAWRRFLRQFLDALVLLLLAATGISLGLWIHERPSPLPYEAMAIFAVVLLNAILGFVQEARAEQAVASLRALSADEAAVVREGERRRIPAKDIVAGDLILIEEGDTIPADARLVETTALQCAEAALTGESQPVMKQIAPIPGNLALGDRANMVFSGTAVTYGRGRALVTATGPRTEMGHIARLLRETKDDPTPLQSELDRTGKLLGVIVVLIALVMIVTILVVEDVSGLSALFEVLILGVALAVAAVPEGLPAVVTAVLSLGVQRMARRKAVVRRLSAVETLGSASVIASDKTGTLTRNEMTVRVLLTGSGRVDFGSGGAGGVLQREGGGPVEGAQRIELERALTAAVHANNAGATEEDGTWRIEGDPTEGALIVAAHRAALPGASPEQRLPRLGEAPFSSERKRMSTVHSYPGDRPGPGDPPEPGGQPEPGDPPQSSRHRADAVEEGSPRLVLFAKGAPDVLLERCSAEFVGDEARPLTPQRREEILRLNESLAGEALRTLAVAVRHVPAAASRGGEEHEAAHAFQDGSLETDMIFTGIIGMIDPPRAEAGPAVMRAKEAGIRPLLITGDHPGTASVIARELGIAGDARVTTGRELAALSEEDLDRVVTETSVYARVNPEHKLRIVDALQRGGAIVAMTGDGVNDAPALKSADIGIAMGITGTDVSKEAADMVLIDDNFATIVTAVEEGRAIFANIRKFLRYLLSSNIGEVITMFLGVLLAERLGLRPPGEALVLPLLATQILWINLVTDGLPALALGADPPDPGLMKMPPRPKSERVITGQMWRGIFLVGMVMAAGTLLVLDAALPGGFLPGDGNLGYARTMAFTTLMLFQVFNVFNARSDERSALRGFFSNRWLWGALAVSVAAQLAVVYVEPLQRAFSTVALRPADWLQCVGVASSVLWIRELSKGVRRMAAGRQA